MKLIFLILVISSLHFFIPAKAQNFHFISSGVIHFEKRINLYARIKKTLSVKDPVKQQAFEQFKLTQPQFRVLESKLYFSAAQSLFEPLNQTSGDNVGYFGEDLMGGQINVVFKDRDNKIDVVEKKILGEVFLLKDSTRKMVWKLTEETREIAGFPCKRANGLIQDSIYVVAFYTEKILSSSGPESFGGLPGMILGLALPHENITWFATEVEEKTIAPSVIKPPTAGKEIPRRELATFLLPMIKRNNFNERNFLKGIML
ncbi:GLPGLI family protein [Pedobacter aquatilis]|uniref:GLPGLI family protein n=1 Tax=Pedobacter aquatilis TaxID=351343 RepID=UPI0029315922|nr:GLPGLI family protein [Pedobacter aquatilis]